MYVFYRFYDKFISVNAPERRKMGLHVTSSAEGVDFTEDEKIIVETIGQKVSEIQKFKSQFPLKPITQPFVEMESLRRSTWKFKKIFIVNWWNRSTYLQYKILEFWFLEGHVHILGIIIYSHDVKITGSFCIVWKNQKFTL